LHSRWCCGCCTIGGVVGGVMGIAPQVVSRTLYHMWCCGHPTVWYCGCPTVWCHGHPTMCGVTGIVCGATGIAPCVVLWSQLLCHVVLWLCGGCCCATWCRSRNHHCHGHCSWWLGCGRPWKERTATRLSARRVVGEHGDWTAKEEISRKKRKKKKDILAEGKMLPTCHSL